jgi:hypothetical protein
MDFDANFDPTSSVDFNASSTFDNMENSGQNLDFEEFIDYNATEPIAEFPGYPVAATETQVTPQLVQDDSTALPGGDQVDWSTFHAFSFPDQTLLPPTYGDPLSSSLSRSFSSPSIEYSTSEYYQQPHFDNVQSFHSFLNVPVPAQQGFGQGKHDSSAAVDRPFQQGLYAANYTQPNVLVGFFF